MKYGNKRLVRSFAKTLFCIAFIVATTNVFVAGKGKLVEEGWRQRRTFEVNAIWGSKAEVGCTVFGFFSSVHKEMAMLAKKALETFCMKSKKRPEGIVTCMICIIPFFRNGGQVSCGNPVYLRLSPRKKSKTMAKHVLAFVSEGGALTCPVWANTVYSDYLDFQGLRIPLLHPVLGVDEIEISSMRRGVFFVSGTADEGNIFHLQRCYIDPQLLELNLRFRYMQNLAETCFNGGNYWPLFNIHNRTMVGLQQRRSQIHSVNLVEYFVNHSIDEVLHFFEPQKGALKEFNKSQAANSYTCAEQCALDFLQDRIVVDNLKCDLQVDNPNFLGILVNIHTTETPCSTCITSIARESQQGGVFRMISNGKPVGVICSCGKMYERSRIPTMIQYRDTQCFDDEKCMKQPYLLDLTPGNAHFESIPVVLLDFKNEIDQNLIFARADVVVDRQSSGQRHQVPDDYDLGLLMPGDGLS